MLKKLFVFTVVFAMTAMTMPAVKVEAEDFAAGDLIKSSASSAVYYYDGTELLVFPHEKMYFTYYPDWSGVQTISADDLAGLPFNGKHVTVRPGTVLIKVPDFASVYAVEPGGVLRHVADEATAVTLWGDAWASIVIDIGSSFFSAYDNTDAMDNPVVATAHPVGSLIRYTDSDDIYYIDVSVQKRLVTEDGFTANFFNEDYVVENVADTITYTDGTSVTVVEADLFPIAEGVVVPPVTGGDLSIALSVNTPASGTIPSGTVVDFLKFNLTAGDANVGMNSLVVSLTGLGDAQYVNEVTIYVAGVKVGTTRDMSISNRNATFNFSTPIEILASTSKEVTVKAKIETLQTGYFALVINSASDILVDGGSVTGTFPITGSTMNAVTGVTLGELTFDAEDNDTSAQVGEDEVNLVEFTVAADNEEDISFQGLTLKNSGTIRGSEMGEMALYYDDVVIATAQLNDDKYVSFAFDPILIEKGQTEDFKVLGDFDGGATGDTMILYIKDDVDVVAYGATYGYQTSVAKTAMDNDAGDSTTITLTAGDLVINFDKTAVPAANIKKDTTDVVLGRLEMTANAETVRITALTFTSSGTAVSSDDLEEFELVDLATGGITDLSAAHAGNTYTLTTTEEILINQGETKTWDVRVNVTATAETDDKYNVTLASGGITAEGETSGSTVSDITPSSITSKDMTVVVADLTHAVKTLNAVTTIAGGSDISAYKATLKASTASAITVKKVIFEDDNASTASTFNNDDITSVDLVIDGNVVKTLSGTKIVESSTENKITFDGFTYVVPAGATHEMYLKLNFASTITKGTSTNDFALNVLATTGITAKDEDSKTVAVTEDTAAGPTITVNNNGYLDVWVHSDDVNTPGAAYVIAGETSDPMGVLKFDAQYEDVKVTKLALVNQNIDNVNNIAKVELMNKATSEIVAESTDITLVDSGDLDGAYATGTFTMADLACVADETTTTTINGVDVAYKSLTADCNGTDGEDTIAILAKLVIAINTDVTVSPLVTAAATANTITITADTHGPNYTLAATTDSAVQVIVTPSAVMTGGIVDTLVNDTLVTFDDWNYIVEEVGITELYPIVTTKEIGPSSEQVGTDAGVDIIFEIHVIEAEGNESANILSMVASAAPSATDSINNYEDSIVDGDTANTVAALNSVHTAGVKVTSIVNDLSDGALTNGQKIIGKFKFNVASGNNKTDAGEASEFAFGSILDITVSQNNATTLQNTGGTNDFYIYWLSQPNTKVTITDWIDDSGTIAANLAALPSIIGEDTLIIEAVNITDAGNDGDYVQIKLMDINSSSNNDFDWLDGLTTDENLGVRLLYSDVAGGILSN